jgi:hypothetical protein
VTQLKLSSAYTVTTFRDDVVFSISICGLRANCSNIIWSDRPFPCCPDLTLRKILSAYITWQQIICSWSSQSSYTVSMEFTLPQVY